MNLRRTIVAVLLLGMSCEPVVALAQQTHVHTSTPVEAQRLAEIFASISLSETVMERALAKMADTLFTQQPDLEALNNVYPGVDKVFIDTMRTIIRDDMARLRPFYTTDLSQLFGARFTEAELRQLMAFWQSEPAQNVLAAAMQNIDLAGMSQEALNQLNDDPDKEIVFSEETMKSDIRKGLEKADKNVRPRDREAFIRFNLSPVGRKFTQIEKEKREIEARWLTGTSSPELEKQINIAMPKALEEHIKKIEDEKRGKMSAD